MKIKTSIRAGGLQFWNRTEKVKTERAGSNSARTEQTRTPRSLRTYSRSLKVRTGVRAGGWDMHNRCEKLSRSLKVRTGVRAGGWHVQNRWIGE